MACAATPSPLPCATSTAEVFSCRPSDIARDSVGISSIVQAGAPSALDVLRPSLTLFSRKIINFNKNNNNLRSDVKGHDQVKLLLSDVTSQVGRLYCNMFVYVSQ